MSDIAIEVNHVWKRFRKGEINDSLRDLIPSITRGLLGRNNKSVNLDEGGFWALRDIDFQVRRGEILGIIGPNGAGKSTMLKLLSNILKPNKGQIKVNGRLTALIEVGAGFHQDLTGRENIYLNGAILGMKKFELDKIFDEIVDFSGIEEFIDTPVKRYSSGMYARLGFAVAAHVDPEILLVDEVLAVGDAAFQKKSLGKMGDVAKEGRTVLFVSHNMGAITRLCQRALLMEEGRIAMDHNPSDLVRRYQSQYLTTKAQWIRSESVESDKDFAFLKIVVGNGDQQADTIFSADKAIPVEIRYVVNRELSGCQIGVHIYNSEETVVFYSADSDCYGVPALAKSPGFYRVKFIIPKHFLAPGSYHILAVAHSPGICVYELIEHAVVFEISPTGSLTSFDGRLGVVTPLIRWEAHQVKAS